jgi:hypothetical protein
MRANKIEGRGLWEFRFFPPNFLIFAHKKCSLLKMGEKHAKICINFTFYKKRESL